MKFSIENRTKKRQYVVFNVHMETFEANIIKQVYSLVRVHAGSLYPCVP